MGWSTIAIHRAMDVLLLSLMVEDSCCASCTRLGGTKRAEDISRLEVIVSGKSASETEYRGECASNGVCMMELTWRPSMYTPPLTAAARQKP